MRTHHAFGAYRDVLEFTGAFVTGVNDGRLVVINTNVTQHFIAFRTVQLVIDFVFEIADGSDIRTRKMVNQIFGSGIGGAAMGTNLAVT
jgi:hypothetical protein